MIKMKHWYILIGVLFIFSACNCNEDIINDNTYLHIMADNGSSNVTIGSDVKNIATYSVFLSSRLISDKFDVSYKITVGDGLTEGIDYQLITTGTTLSFLPGIYDMPIRVRWLPHTVDSTKDNTLKITLVSNTLGLTMGVPGPSGLQRELVITKVNN